MKYILIQLFRSSHFFAVLHHQNIRNVSILYNKNHHTNQVVLNNIMLDKILSKLKGKQKNKQKQPKLTKSQFPAGKQLKQTILELPKIHENLSQSTFYTTHIPLMLQPEQIEQMFNNKLKMLYKNFQSISTSKKVFQMHLASIILSLTEEDGLHYMFVKFWIQFCLFQLDKIVKKYEDPIHLQQKVSQVSKYFHKQLFLLCFFLHKLTLHIYNKPITQYKEFSTLELFQLIKRTLTSIKGWQKIYRFFLKHIKCKPQNFTQDQIQQNMQQLQKICQLSKIPAPFSDSVGLLQDYIRQAEIEKKLKKSVLLIDKLKQEMALYRNVNQIKKDYVFCTDDVLSALTFVMWRLGKNLYGPCIYVRIVLCCQYESIKEEELAEILNKFGENVRHSFQTIYSISKIGLLEQDKINSIL